MRVVIREGQRKGTKESFRPARSRLARPSPADFLRRISLRSRTEIRRAKPARRNVWLVAPRCSADSGPRRRGLADCAAANRRREESESAEWTTLGCAILVSGCPILAICARVGISGSESSFLISSEGMNQNPNPLKSTKDGGTQNPFVRITTSVINSNGPETTADIGEPR